jgi:hypothetical protein
MATVEVLMTAMSRTVVCCEMSRSMRSYDIVVVLEGMTVQYAAPGVCSHESATSYA